MKRKYMFLVVLVLMLFIGEAWYREILHIVAAITGTLLIAFCLIYARYNEKGRLL